MKNALSPLIKEEISQMEWLLKDLEPLLRASSGRYATSLKPAILRIQESLVDIQRTLETD